MALGTSVPPLASAFPASALRDLLDISLTALHVVSPLYGLDGTTLVDFSLDYLNPAGQRMTGLPEHPGGTALTRFPHTVATGIFDYYRRVFATGETLPYEVNYQADGLDNYFRFQARRSGELLVVSFTDTSDQNRSAVELALRESQAAEQAARAEAEQQRQRFREVLQQLPAYVAVYHGPDHIYQFVNPPYQSRFPHRTFLGRPFREGTPEAVELGVVALCDQVYQTGQPYYFQEMEGWFDFHGTGQLEQIFLNLVLHPLRDAQGRLDGVLDFSYNVTEQVRARRQVEQLNQELESRVQQRTGEALALQADLLTAAQHQAAERLAFFHIFEQAPVLVALLRSPAHRFEYVNPAYQALFPGRQLVGLDVAEAVPEITAQGFGALLDRVYQTGETYTGQQMPFTAQPPPGQPPRTVYYNFTHQAYRENGQIVGVSIFAFDVTEQVLARRVVEESAQQVRALVESAPFPIGVYVGPELRIQLANEAILTAWGKGLHVVGQRYADVLPELATQAVFEQLHQVLTTGEPLHLRNQRIELVIAGTLQTFYFNYSFTPLRDTQGQVYGVLNTAADVTDLVLARQRLESYAAQLQESEARFRTMADAAPNLVWAVHPDSTIRYVNRAFLDFVGLADEHEYMATGWGPYLHPDEAALTSHTLVQAIAQRLPYVLEHRMLRHDGQYRWLLAQGAPSYLQDGELFGYVGSAIDITELKQVNEQLQRTNVDLDTFVYTASHDLKAPITNIEGILLALRDTLPPPVQQDEVVTHLLALLDDTVARFQFTIAQLTDISRLQLAHAGPAEPVQLAPMVEHVRLDLVPALAAASTQLTVAMAPDLVLSFSPANLRSVVYNLLSNAVKYRALDRPSQVQVRAEQQGPAVVLTVQDNGLGMSEVQQRQLFGLFQRLHTHVEGTGVGLYITKRLVENAGGTIQVQSQPNVGTTFTVTLPV